MSEREGSREGHWYDRVESCEHLGRSRQDNGERRGDGAEGGEDIVCWERVGA